MSKLLQDADDNDAKAIAIPLGFFSENSLVGKLKCTPKYTCLTEISPSLQNLMLECPKSRGILKTIIDLLLSPFFYQAPKLSR